MPLFGGSVAVWFWVSLGAPALPFVSLGAQNSVSKLYELEDDVHYQDCDSDVTVPFSWQMKHAKCKSAFAQHASMSIGCSGRLTEKIISEDMGLPEPNKNANTTTKCFKRISALAK